MSRCSKTCLVSLGAAVTAVGVWVLYTYPPAAYRWYPRCVFKTLTGLDCPGCGTTRALHHLLHGRVTEAFHFNPMLFVVFVVALFALPSILRGQQPRFITRPWFGWTTLVVLTGYWIVRNTPLYPWPLPG